MVSKAMKVSTIIPTKNRRDYLKECLESIVVQTHPPDEIVIVDNSTNDETEQYIKNWQDSVKFRCIYIRQIKGGTASLRNTAIKRCSGDIVFFFDDDIILDRRYIQAMVEIFTADARNEIGGITGWTWDIKDIGTISIGEPAEIGDIIQNGGDLSKKLQELVLYRYGKDIFKESFVHHFTSRIAKMARDTAKSFFIMESPRKGKVLASGFRSAFPRVPQSTPFLPVEWLQGGNMACRREVLQRFRFDENLELLSPYALSEDIEFSLRVGRTYKLAVTSRAKLIHKHTPTGKLDPRKQFVSIVVNQHYIVNKNMDHLGNIVAFWWAVLGIMLSCVVLLIFRPCEKNWQRLSGVIEGIRICAKGKT